VSQVSGFRITALPRASIFASQFAMMRQEHPTIRVFVSGLSTATNTKEKMGGFIQGALHRSKVFGPNLAQSPTMIRLIIPIIRSRYVYSIPG